jgi:alkanesulfonate monooxygenase SsuD/methylene tetrahydromethanopterin reductase-like flavin-dependent oxidoreductase (luciferase family)
MWTSTPNRNSSLKSATGENYPKKHDNAATPHRRAQAHPNLPTTAKATLTATYFDINPAALQRHIQALMNELLTLAKALATGDMLSGGRLTVGLGIGGRVEDYRAVGADPATQTMRGMAESVAVMKRVWDGEKITESVLPVGPAPVQPGGPPLLVGTIGPKTLRSAAAWADGLAGTTLDLDVAKQNELFDVARHAWADAGRAKPHLATSFWFALGSVDEARRQVHRHLRRYMNWIPVEYIDGMALTTGFAGSEDDLVAVLREFEAVGADEIQLIPTSSDLEQVQRAGDLVEAMQGGA